VNVRDLAWGDFSGWVDLYYSRYEEIGRNPDLGVYLRPARPSVAEEASLFGTVMKAVADGEMVAAVAEEGGAVVGTCTVQRKGRHLEDRHVGVLAVAVYPDARGRGIGDALLAQALERCRGVFEIVELTVVSINERAIRLYRKHGFEVAGRHPRGFKRGDRYLDDLLMWRPIEPAATP
jgi:ribosomal protein S18 acetylase RimI-like enzyme